MCPKLGERWLRVAGERRIDGEKKTRYVESVENFFFFSLRVHFLNLNIVIWKFLHEIVRRRTRLSAATAANTSKKTQKSIIYVFSISLSFSIRITVCGASCPVVYAEYIARAMARVPHKCLFSHIFYVQNSSAATSRRSKRDLLLFDSIDVYFHFLPWNNLEKSLTSSQPHRIASHLFVDHCLELILIIDLIFWCVSFGVSFFVSRTNEANSLDDWNRIGSNKTVVADTQPVAVDGSAPIVLLYSTSSIGSRLVCAVHTWFQFRFLRSDDKTNNEEEENTRKNPLETNRLCLLYPIVWHICDLTFDLTWSL